MAPRMKEFQKNCGEGCNFISSIFYFWLVNDGYFLKYCVLKGGESNGRQSCQASSFSFSL